MKSTQQIIFIIFFLFVATSLNAQRSYIRNAIRDKNEQEHGEPAKDKLNGWLDNVNNAEVRPTYTFNQSITYHATRFSRGKWASGTDEQYFYNAKEQYSATKLLDGKTNVFTIMDVQKTVQIICNTKENTLIAFNANAFMSKKTQDAHEHSDGDIIDDKLKATGQTKKILGYTCNEFVKKNDAGDITQQLWIVSTSEFLGYGVLNFTTGVLKGKTNKIIMEMTHYFHNVPRETMIATAINKNDKWIINTADFTKKGMEHVR